MPNLEELQFQAWYQDWANKLRLNPNPDDPRHFYDWRGAFKAGALPDQSGHWPSQFKLEGHPNMFVGGIDTKTRMPLSALTDPAFMNAYVSKMRGRR